MNIKRIFLMFIFITKSFFAYGAEKLSATNSFLTQDQNNKQERLETLDRLYNLLYKQYNEATRNSSKKCHREIERITKEEKLSLKDSLNKDDIKYRQTLWHMNQVSKLYRGKKVIYSDIDIRLIHNHGRHLQAAYNEYFSNQT